MNLYSARIDGQFRDRNEMEKDLESSLRSILRRRNNECQDNRCDYRDDEDDSDSDTYDDYADENRMYSRHPINIKNNKPLRNTHSEMSQSRMVDENTNEQHKNSHLRFIPSMRQNNVIERFTDTSINPTITLNISTVILIVMMLVFLWLLYSIYKKQSNLEHLIHHLIQEGHRSM